MEKGVESKLTRFSAAVVKIVRQIPSGKVVSYGQVAAYVGLPRGARQVGWVLRQIREVEHPWWRVINNQGRISIKGNMEHDAMEQKDLLEREGVEVGEDFSINIAAYRFVASQAEMKDWGLDQEYLQVVWRKSGTGF